LTPRPLDRKSNKKCILALRSTPLASNRRVRHWLLRVQSLEPPRTFPRSLRNNDGEDLRSKTEGLENMLDDLRTSGVIFRKKNPKEEGPWSTYSGDNQGRNNDRIESVWTFSDGLPTLASHRREGCQNILAATEMQRTSSLFDEDREKVTWVPSFLKRLHMHPRR
jgi:hypothetical protein